MFSFFFGDDTDKVGELYSTHFIDNLIFLFTLLGAPTWKWDNVKGFWFKAINCAFYRPFYDKRKHSGF